MFDLRRKNLIYKAIDLEKAFPPKFIRVLNTLFSLFAIILFLLLFQPAILGLTTKHVFALFLFCFCFFIVGVIYLTFLDALRENFLLRSSLAERISDEVSIKSLNLAEHLDFRVARAVVRADKFCKSRGVPLNIFSIIFNLWQDKRGRMIFDKIGLDKEIFKEKLKSELARFKKDDVANKEEFDTVLEKSALLAINNFHRHIEIRDFLVAASEGSRGFREALATLDMDLDDVNHVTVWEDYLEYNLKRKRQFWRLENLLKKRGVGKKWASGYTVNLDKYSVEITEIIKKQNLSIHLIGHQKEIYAIERILARSGENNVLLVGRSGSGRSTIVYGFAQKVAEGNSFSNLNDKRVLELDMQAVLAGLDTPGEILERLRIIFSEAVSAGNVILVIDEIHNYLGSDKGPAALDITSVMLPYLSSSSFQVIGITTYDGWHKYVENNASVNNLFVKVEVNEATAEQTILILEDMLPGLERKYGISASYKVLRDIVRLTERYIQGVPFPEKAIDILTEAFVYAASKGEKLILSDDINKIISERVEVPVGTIQETEREKLLNLEDRIHARIINQEEAVKVISEAMRRARVGIKGGKRPIGSFLFLGPTGVGKTETSKALAEAYYGSDERMIRFDMSEYQETSSINRLIGSVEAGEPGLFVKAISDNPFSLILLDEIEKAHPNILNLFLQVFDEGWLTDAFGKRISLTDCIIIGTSNAGAELIRQRVKERKPLESFKEDLTDFLLKKGIFKPEFLNRFDAVVTFRPLTHEHLIKIAILMMNDLSKRLMEGMGIRIVVNPDLIEKIVELGYQPEFGARPMRRVIQDEIESKIARIILEKNLKRGDFVEIKANDVGG